MVTVVAESVAEAPPTGVTAKLTTPPSTGSIESLAVTVMANALGNGWLIGVDWELVPWTSASLKPWLWKAPMSGAIPFGRATPRWSVPGAPLGVPALIAGLPGSTGIVGVGPP